MRNRLEATPEFRISNIHDRGFGNVQMKAAETGPAHSQDRVALLVLGMHRSGTSALTRTLNLLGADLPRNLYAARKDNPTGYWESADWIELHDELLATFGRSWDSPLPLPPAASTPEAMAPFRARLAASLRGDFANSRMFVAKDPRICRLLPLWHAALADAGFAPRHLIIVRHPDEVAASLAVRNEMPRETALLLWMRHMLESERASRGMPRVFVSYDALLADWRSVIDHVASAFKFQWPKSPADVQAEIESFLRRDLRHHEVDNGAGLVRGGWPSALYEASLAALDDDMAQVATFDRIRGELAAGAELIDGFFATVVDGERENARLTDEVQRLTGLLRSRAAELTAARSKITRLRARLSAMKSSWSWRLTTPLRLVRKRKSR